MNATPNDVRSFAVGLDENGNSAGARFILTVADELERLQRIESVARDVVASFELGEKTDKATSRLAAALDRKP